MKIHKTGLLANLAQSWSRLGSLLANEVLSLIVIVGFIGGSIFGVGGFVIYMERLDYRLGFVIEEQGDSYMQIAYPAGFPLITGRTERQTLYKLDNESFTELWYDETGKPINSYMRDAIHKYQHNQHENQKQEQAQQLIEQIKLRRQQND